MKVIIKSNSKATPFLQHSPMGRQAEQFMSEMVSRQRNLEAEFRSFSSSMVQAKTIEVIS